MLESFPMCLFIFFYFQQLLVNSIINLCLFLDKYKCGTHVKFNRRVIMFTDIFSTQVVAYATSNIEACFHNGDTTLNVVNINVLLFFIVQVNLNIVALTL